MSLLEEGWAVLEQLINFKILLLAILVFVPFEQILPMHADQKIFRRGWLNDLVYFLLNGIVVRLGLFAVILLIVAASDTFLPSGLRLAVASQPHWLQAIELIVLADLGFYSVHRLFHAVPFLWRFHSIHHSIEELDWLAAHRVHPVDQILTKGASLIPCFALGFSEWAIGAYFLFYHWHSLLLHANVRLGFGPLRWLVASPEFHHWHHSRQHQARDRNFAGQVALWDLLFGTMYMPKDKQPSQYGLDDPIPSGYVSQFFHPFRKPAADALSADAKVAELEAHETLQTRLSRG
jgi:sterol desaturase/sphingolipid hydroxylase (fatty acid hydroxylase superfamily)